MRMVPKITIPYTSL